MIRRLFGRKVEESEAPGENKKLGPCDSVQGEMHALVPVPVALTSLGRSGSSVVLGSLGCHPEVAVFKLFSEEAHYMNYFSQLIKTLSSPGSYLYPVRSGNLSGDNILTGNSALVAPLEETKDNEWFVHHYLPEMRAFFQAKLGEYYQWKKASYQGEGSSRFICEKFAPSGAIDVVQEIFPDMKEIILVRDFRDILCSILAFNEKRGFKSFGLEQCSSTEEYVEQHLAVSVNGLFTRWRSVKETACLVRYEDFIADKESVLAQMFHYIGAESQNAGEVVETALRSQPETQRQWHCTSGDALSSVARYQYELSPELIALCNDIMKQPLQEFGYLG